MILEQVIMPVRAGRAVRAGREAEFEAAFAEARLRVEASVGFRGLSLTRGVEDPDNYLLLNEWDSVEAHEIGFRGSPAYEQWSSMVHGFCEPFPTVAHFEPRRATQSRAGVRRETSTEGPHRQVTQKSPPAPRGRLVARSFALPGVIEGHSSVSPASSRTPLLASRPELLAPGSHSRCRSIRLSRPICMERMTRASTCASRWSVPRISAIGAGVSRTSMPTLARRSCSMAQGTIPSWNSWSE